MEKEDKEEATEEINNENRKFTKNSFNLLIQANIVNKTIDNVMILNHWEKFINYMSWNFF